MPQIQVSPNVLYTGILKSLGFTVTPVGDVLVEDKPIMFEHRKVVIPTDDKLREGNWSENIPFHPLSENEYRGESPVIKFLRGSIQYRVLEMLSFMIGKLASIAADTGSHRTLKADLKKFLQIVPDADEAFLRSVEKILGKVQLEGNNMLYHVYLKRGGTIKDEKYSRAAIVTFPFMQQLKETGTVFGVKLRKKDIPTFESLINYILFGTNAADPESYSYGSHDLYAPYFDALVGAYHRIASRLKELAYKFRSRITDEEELAMMQPDMEWYDMMNQLSVLRNIIPPLKDAEGAPVAGQEDAEVEVITTPSTAHPVLATAPPHPTSSYVQSTTPVAETPVQSSLIHAEPIHASNAAPANATGESVYVTQANTKEAEVDMILSAPPIPKAQPHPTVAQGYVPAYLRDTPAAQAAPTQHYGQQHYQAPPVAQTAQYVPSYLREQGVTQVSHQQQPKPNSGYGI